MTPVQKAVPADISLSDPFRFTGKVFYGHGRINGFRAFDGDGRGRRGKTGGIPEILSAQIRPDQPGHKSVSGTGGILDIGPEHRKGTCLFFIRIKNAMGSHGDKYALQSCPKKCVGGLLQILFAPDPDAGEIFRLQQIGLERMDPAKTGSDTSGS